MIGSYNKALNAYPLLTQCTTTGKFDLDYCQQSSTNCIFLFFKIIFLHKYYI